MLMRARLFKFSSYTSCSTPLISLATPLNCGPVSSDSQHSSREARDVREKDEGTVLHLAETSESENRIISTVTHLTSTQDCFQTHDLEA